MIRTATAVPVLSSSHRLTHAAVSLALQNELTQSTTKKTLHLDMESGVATFFGRIVVARYSNLSSLAFLWYDYCLTFDAEVEYVWRYRWTLGKALFMFNRYFGLSTLAINVIGFLDDSLAFYHPMTGKLCVVRCTGVSWWEAISTCITLVGVEIILLTRIYAVYERNKKILICLACLLVLEVVAIPALYAFNLGERSLRGAPGVPWTYRENMVHFDGLLGCYKSTAKQANYFIWIPTITLETFLCLMMLYKAWQMYNDDWRNPLLNLLIWDSVLYFVTISAILLVNCLIWALVAQQTSDLIAATSWTIALSTALGSRLLLNMNKRYFEGQTLYDNDPGSSLRIHNTELAVLSTIIQSEQ